MNQYGRFKGVGRILALGLGVMPVLAAVANVPERWEAGHFEGWVSYDLVNERAVNRLSVSDGKLGVSFAAQSTKTPPEYYLVRADGESSGGVFSGDYLAAGVQAVTFRLFCPHSTEVSLRLYSEESDRVWRYRISGVRTGEWVRVTVPIAPDVLFNRAGVEGWSAFRDDIRNVAWIGVAIERHSSMAAQTYWLDDFELVGPGPDFAAWMAQFPDPGDGPAGVNLLPCGDLDGDGQSNVSEWIAGTSAGDARDVFQVKVGPVAQGRAGFPLKWTSVAGRRYVVWRSRDLTRGFEPMTEPIPATPPENTFLDPAAGDGPVFYRLEVSLE